jgi:hypothetical protein
MSLTTRRSKSEIVNIQQAAVDATEKRGGTRKKHAPQGRALHGSMNLAFKDRLNA